MGFAWNENVRMVVGWRCGTVDDDVRRWWCGVLLLHMGVCGACEWDLHGMRM